MNNITVPVSEVVKLKKKIDKINTQCQRHNLDEVTLVQSEPYFKTFKKTFATLKDGIYNSFRTDGSVDLKPKEITKKVVDLEVSGEAPVVNQYYKVIGFVENGNVKGEKIIELWDKSSQWEFPYESVQRIKDCNHCNTKRNRNKIYIIELTDYVPLESDEGWKFPLPQYSILGVLEATAAIIRVYGWVSVGNANGRTTTRSRVEYYLGVYKDKFGVNNKTIKITKEDKELSKKALEWITGLPTDDLCNDYLNNLFVACSQEKISSKLFGIVCSVFVGYQYNNKNT
jgi:hypothetical protein